jgi:hypothetical protein
MVELVRVAVLWNAAATGSVLELKDILPHTLLYKES